MPNELLMYTMSNSNFQMIIKRLEYSLYSEFNVIWDLSFSYTMYIQNVKIWNKMKIVKIVINIFWVKKRYNRWISVHRTFASKCFNSILILQNFSHFSINLEVGSNHKACSIASREAAKVIRRAGFVKLQAPLHSWSLQRQVSLFLLRMQGTCPPMTSLYPCTSSHL